MVYIEEVFFHNLIINFILLKLAAYVTRARLGTWRFIVGALVGAVFAVMLPFITQGVIIYKLTALFATTAVFWRRKGARTYFLYTLAFAGVSFATGGAVYAAYHFAGASVSARTMPFKGVIFAVFGCLALLAYTFSQIRKTVLKRQISALTGDTAEITINNIPFTVKCIVDTGNRLVDNLTQRPVAVLSGDVGLKLSGKERTLTVRTVTDTRELPLVMLENVVLNTPKGRLNLGSISAVIGGIEGGCRLILPAAI